MIDQTLSHYRVAAANFSIAISFLQEIERQAEKFGLVRSQLHARLTLGQVEMRAAKSVAADPTASLGKRGARQGIRTHCGEGGRLLQ
jgi:hypothetical protein